MDAVRDLLIVLLDSLKEKLWSTDWLQRESGILALGAMAEGEQSYPAVRITLVISLL
jgi:hypothetical protein